MNKTLVILAGLVVLVLGMTACGDKTPSEQAKATGEAVGDAAEATGDAVSGAAKASGEAVGDALQATGDFLSQSKEEDVKSARETLDEIEKNWQDLLARAEPPTDEGKVAYKIVRDQMTETLADAREKLVEAEDASADDWQQNIKPELDAALQKAQKIYKDAADKFGGK